MSSRQIRQYCQRYAYRQAEGFRRGRYPRPAPQCSSTGLHRTGDCTVQDWWLFSDNSDFQHVGYSLVVLTVLQMKWRQMRLGNRWDLKKEGAWYCPSVMTEAPFKHSGSKHTCLEGQGDWPTICIIRSDSGRLSAAKGRVINRRQAYCPGNRCTSNYTLFTAELHRRKHPQRDPRGVKAIVQVFWSSSGDNKKGRFVLYDTAHYLTVTGITL